MWSKTKKKVESFLADSLKGRLEFNCSNYRMHDGIGRIYITFDKQEIFNMCTLRRDYYRTPKDGEVSQVEFLEAFHEYQNSSIEDSLKSDNSLLRMLAVLDRRVGKRTLENLKDKMEFEEELVKRFFELRCSLEGIV